MADTNKVPNLNSLIDLKSAHNDQIDNQNIHGYYNFISNGDFQSMIADDDSEIIIVEA